MKSSDRVTHSGKEGMRQITFAEEKEKEETKPPANSSPGRKEPKETNYASGRKRTKDTFGRRKIHTSSNASQKKERALRYLPIVKKAGA